MGRVFLTWTPVEAQARLVNPTGTDAVRVTLRSAGPVGGLRFATTRTHLGTPTLALSLPVERSAGSLLRRRASSDARAPPSATRLIEARGAGTLGVLGTKPVTVRVRKNAQTLSPPSATVSSRP